MTQNKKPQNKLRTMNCSSWRCLKCDIKIIFINCQSLSMILQNLYKLPMDFDHKGKYYSKNDRKISINERTSSNGDGGEEVITSSKNTPKNNLNSPKSNDQVKSDQCEEYMELLGLNRDGSMVNSSQNNFQERNIESVKLKFQKEQLNRQHTRLKNRIWERQQMIKALEQHNDAISEEILKIDKEAKKMAKKYEEELEEKQEIIEELRRALEEKDQQLEGMIDAYEQRQKLSQEKVTQLEADIKELKEGMSENYNQMLLVKERQIQGLEEKLKDKSEGQKKNKAQNQFHLYTLAQENRQLKQRVQQLQQYSENKDQILKKISAHNDEMTLENQLLKQKKAEENFIPSLDRHNSASKEVLQLKSKYQLLQEINRKLEMEIDGIISEAQEMRKRETMLEMEVEELEQKITQLSNEEKKIGDITQRQFRKDAGKIKQVKALTPKSSFKALQKKFKDKNKFVQNLQETENRRKEMDEIIIRSLKQKIEAILTFIHQNIVNKKQELQDQIYEVLRMLDRVPILKASFERNGCDNCNLCDIFQLQENGKDSLIERIQRFHSSKKNNGNEPEKPKEKRLKKPILFIEIDENDNVEKQLYESLTPRYG